MNETQEAKKVLYVTDQGSVKIGARLYLPGEEIDVNTFRGRETALRELIAGGNVARRPGSYNATADGRIVKLRSSEAAPLPTELDEYDPKKKKELRPIVSETPHMHDINQQLADLKKEQRANSAAKEVAQAAEAAKAPEAPAEEPAQEASVESGEDAAEIFDRLAKVEAEEAEGSHDELSDEDFFGDLLEDEGDEPEFELEADVEEDEPEGAEKEGF